MRSDVMTLFTRTVVGLALATLLALAARRSGSLAPSGMWGAVVVGTLATAAGWSWCALLLVFFVTSSLLSAWRAEAKDARTRGIVAKGGARDAWQVAANGGVFALCALGALVAPSPWWSVAGFGALAGATADTWATEVGTALGGAPRSVRTWRVVPAGTSGAVTAAGSWGMLAGAALLGTLAALIGLGVVAGVAVAVGGTAGALADTWLGATLQERRWCPSCRRATEQRVHACGADTEHRGGWAFLDNDAVNLTSTVCGAAAAALSAAIAWGRSPG